MGQEEEPFDRGLGDKDTVKRVAMNMGSQHESVLYVRLE